MALLKKQWHWLIQLGFAVAASVMLVSCETIGYYEQAVRGQLHILLSRQRIDALVADPRTPSDLRFSLMEILRIREFAQSQLGLSAGDSYQSYVELNRDHVLWNVFAAPEFSLDPLEWCFPVAGCVSYRGYFAEDDAIAFASHLTDQGYDVYTGGVDAYSTLGWFDDPLFSTVMQRPADQLAALLFHELAHLQAYVPGDTAFNEGFATFVEQEGVQRWLRDHNDAETAIAFASDFGRQQQFVDLVLSHRDRFAELYASGLPLAQMRSAKIVLQQELRQAYGELKQSWEGYSGYDRWFENSLNNAQLNTVTSYNDLVPAFAGLLVRQDGDLPAFYQAVRDLAALPPDLRSRELERLRQSADGNSRESP